MDSNGNQRKRAGKSRKNINTIEPSSPTNEKEVTEVSAVAISPTLEEAESSPSVPAVAECRRSSRKKIIKFDVRDLLNKNRKTHKIQIEARIDSNAPSTSKSNTSRDAERAIAVSPSTVREDMLSKQKTFLEKSAIFRRYSISQEHKPPPPLPIPPLLGKGTDNKESILSATSTTRRLNRTQEFFSNAMIKPKQTTSLIVAQIESNAPSTTSTVTAKCKNINKSLEYEAKSKLTEVLPVPQQQKKRGRPARPKIKGPNDGLTEDTMKTVKKLTPEKAKNWKEYKACLAQQHNRKAETLQKDYGNDQESAESMSYKKNKQAIEQSNATISLNPEKVEEIALSFKQNQLFSKTHHEEPIQQVEEKKLFQTEHQSVVEQNEDVTAHLEGKEMNSDTEVKNKSKNSVTIEETFKEQMKAEPKHVLKDDIEIAKSIDNNKSFQYLQKHSEIDLEKDVSGFKVLVNKSHAIALKNEAEENTARNNDEKAKETEKPRENSEEIVDEILIDSIATVEETVVLEPVSKEIECSVKAVYAKETDPTYYSDMFSEHEEKGTKSLKVEFPKELENLKLRPKDHNLTIYQPSTPTEETTKTFSRTSSSSESENASDRSSYSSAPSSSASSSSPSSSSYKSIDNLRVSIKRISLPKSPSTSSQTSTSEELHSNVIRKKPPMAKRSKRLQNKSVGKLENQSTCERVEILTTVATQICKTTRTSSANRESISSDSPSKNLQKENLEEIDLKTDTIISNSPVQSNQSTKVDEIIEIANIKPKPLFPKRKSLRNRDVNSDSNDSESDKQESLKFDTENQIIKEKLRVRSPINMQELKAEDTATENQGKLKERSETEWGKIIENINVNEWQKGYDESQKMSSTKRTFKNKTSIETKQQPRDVEKQTQTVVDDENSKHVEKQKSVDDSSQCLANETKSKEVLEISAIESTKEDNKLLKFSDKAACDNEDKKVESVQLLKGLNNKVDKNDTEGRIASSSFIQTELPAVSSENLETNTTQIINISNILEETSISLPKRKLRNQKDKITGDLNSPDDTAILAQPTATAFLTDNIESQKDCNTEQDIKLLPKTRGRKSRSKNLRASDLESETDSTDSTGKKTPIDENILLKPNNDEIEFKTDASFEKKDKPAEVIDAQEHEQNKCKNEITLNADETPNENEKIALETIEVENVKDELATSSNFLSSQIQNVSIETNTLLDILRTVQSNTEAALKASKPTTKSQISDKDNRKVNTENMNLDNKVQELQVTENDKNFKNITSTIESSDSKTLDNMLGEDKLLPALKTDVTVSKTEKENNDNAAAQEDKHVTDLKTDNKKSITKNQNIYDTAQDSQITQADNPLKDVKTTDMEESIVKNHYLDNKTSELQVTQSVDLKDSSAAFTESKTNYSPNRWENESPSTSKGNNFSPSRSESVSPLIQKKSKFSPTRSASSSPLTLKKVTRRYERRSRRGDETTHKTLEETFAEIAAQSSKAVLAAKGIDITETTVDKNLLNVDERQILTDTLEIEVTLANTNEISKEFAEISNTDKVENFQDGGAAKPAEDVKYESNKHESEQTDQKDNLAENQNSKTTLEPQEATKTIPVKRGRKPKSRAQDVLTMVSKDSELKITTKTQKETLKEVEQKKLIETENGEKVKNNSTEEIESITYICEKIEDLKSGNKSIADGDNKISENIPTLTREQTSTLNATIDTTFTTTTTNESKPSKKSNKKRDTSKEMLEVVTESSLVMDESTMDNEEDSSTSKHSTKKRDSSLTKIETKTFVKKLTKKTKNNEESQTMSQKDDTATTPPASKRGRKPKNQQETPPPTTFSSKKKSKKDVTSETKEDDVEEKQEKSSDLENDFKDGSFDKTLDEKLAKKKRQKKLKEAFEAALAEDIERAKESLTAISTPCSTSFGLTPLNKSPPPSAESQLSVKDAANESIRITCITPAITEEDPDPLKDIEKFIADGVNLLKKDYKLDDDSVGDVISSTTEKTSETTLDEKTIDVEIKPIINTFETPADTPINTPSVTPPPKSPTSLESSTSDENSGVRRSHRIKLITKTPKALVGRGLVRDKERLSIKDDVETKSHYTMDDHLTDLAEVEAKNAKFLKEMEERLSNFQVIKENEYLCERIISREAKKMICDCFLTHEEEERGELGCGEDCLNRLLMIECGPDCNVKDRCTNKRFQKLLCSPCRVFRTEKKGFGIMADIEILPGEFIMEYVGEVIDTEEFEKRRIMYSQDKNRHYYFMALRSDAIIDATIKGNISRFINHSCDPNAETQKWTVNGELRIGFFSRKSIMPGEEITFNYQYQRYGREAQRCYCESANCRGWIGQEPTSDEGEQIDDDDESEDDEEEEEADTSNLLVQDDEEDSDTSVADPEEVQKQLEMAAAQAEAELAPLQLLEEKDKKEKTTLAEGKTVNDSNKSENEEDSKSKFKKLLSKMAEKVAAKQKQTKREQKLKRKRKSKESSADLANKLKFLEDPDIEDEVEFLKECGLKNQSDTLRLSRLMVRAKLVQTRLNLLEILRKGDFPCRRLFLDYHGLRLLHGWMSEDAGNMQIRLALLQTLETLPIANKTVLTDSKVMQMVRNWCGNNTSLSPNDDSSSSNSNSQDVPAQASANLEEGSDLGELQKLALKLVTAWEGLPEIFRIPKKERIEQMKEHEREADRQYAANVETSEDTTATNRYRRDRFGRVGFNTFNSTSNNSNRFLKPNNGNPLRITNTTAENIKCLSKEQRREMFAAKVARDEAEKRLAEERREFETKCRFFGLDPKKTRLQDVPFCVNPATGQWFSIERKPISTPPSYAHVQVPVKPKSTDPKDYQLPAVCSTLPAQWKYAITSQGKIYYYHIKQRIPQWEPPSAAQLKLCENEEDDDSESEFTTTAGEDSSDDNEDILIGMDAAQLKAYIDRKVEVRRQKRYQRLVDERAISPRREEDRIYNQIEVRKYKENKEKIRKRKEEIRRRRAEALRQSSLNMCTLGSLTETNPSSTSNKPQTESDEELGALPIQDYLLSSDEDDDIKAEVNSPLIDKIVEGDKIVDELDALTTKRQLKRPLPPHREFGEPSTSSLTPGLNPVTARLEYKKRKLEKKEKRKPKEQDAKYRKTKEKFRCEIAGIIVHYLKPYLKDSCIVGRIQSNEDFNHLARKLTHFVMIKELKYCESVGQTLVVTESVKSKSREFIKKYMAKYGDAYVKPANDPEFKDIPFTL